MNANGPLVSAMVVVGPPLPVKMPRPPVSRSAKNATVPLLLREGPPKPNHEWSAGVGDGRGGSAAAGEDALPTRVQGGEERHRAAVVEREAAERGEWSAGVDDGRGGPAAAGEDALPTRVQGGPERHRAAVVERGGCKKQLNGPPVSAMLVKLYGAAAALPTDKISTIHRTTRAVPVRMISSRTGAFDAAGECVPLYSTQ